MQGRVHRHTVAPLAVVCCIIFGIACKSTGDSPDIGIHGEDAGGDAAQDARESGAIDGVAPHCVLAGNACVGDPQCCEPLRGALVDLDAGCVGQADPFECEALGAGCTYQATPGCLFRLTDGGREVFAIGSQVVPEYLSSTSVCDPQLAGYVDSIRNTKCP